MNCSRAPGVGTEATVGSHVVYMVNNLLELWGGESRTRPCRISDPGVGQVHESMPGSVVGWDQDDFMVRDLTLFVKSKLNSGLQRSLP